MNRVPASLVLLLLHQEADAQHDERLRVGAAALRQWVHRGHITRGPGGYDLTEILTYLEQRERSTSVEDLITRLTYDGQLVTAPTGTVKCAQGVRPHPSDWAHWLFAASDPGPMLQLMTRCGRRAHRFVLESEGNEVDCPECVEMGPSAQTDTSTRCPHVLIEQALVQCGLVTGHVGDHVGLGLDNQPIRDKQRPL